MHQTFEIVVNAALNLSFNRPIYSQNHATTFNPYYKTLGGGRVESKHN